MNTKVPALIHTLIQLACVIAVAIAFFPLAFPLAYYLYYNDRQLRMTSAAFNTQLEINTHSANILGELRARQLATETKLDILEERC